MLDKLKSDEKKNLNKKAISELRELGRGVGVKSPTLLSKEELIDEILEIVLGESFGFDLDETRGRPTARSIFPYSCDIHQDNGGCGRGVLSAPHIENPKQFPENDIFEGMVMIGSDGYYVTGLNFDVSDKKKIAYDETQIKPGDIVSYILFNDKAIIIDVGGEIKDKNEVRPSFEKLVINYPKTKYLSATVVDKIAPIAKGSKTTILDKSIQKRTLGYTIVKNISRFKNSPVIFELNIDMGDDDKKIDYDFVDAVINVNSYEELDIIKDKLELFKCFIERIVESNESVLVYMTNFNNYDAVNKVAKYIKDWLVEFFKFAGAYNNGSSITIINECADVKVFERFSEMSTNIIYTTDKEKCRIYPPLCETLFKDTFLTIGEIDNIKYIKDSWQKFSDEQKYLILN